MMEILLQWFLAFFDLTVVSNKWQGSPSGFSDQETPTAVRAVVPLLIFLRERSINTFMYLVLSFLNLLMRSRVGTTSHSRFLRLRFEFQVHLGQFFTVRRGRQGVEHLLMG